MAAIHGLRTFYSDLGHETEVCDGTACISPEEHSWQSGCVRPARSAPCVVLGTSSPRHRFVAATLSSLVRPLSLWPNGSMLSRLARRPLGLAQYRVLRWRILLVVLRNLTGSSSRPSLDEYELPDGDTILATLEQTHLRGRGGAAFPTAAKWRSARDAPGAERYVVANGDEGDPGSYVDRLLLEEDPHAVLAGMLACARAIGARNGIVYIRSEYPRAQRVMRAAILEACDAKRLGDEFDVEVVSGAGSYICGEETALLNSIQGLRGEPRTRPPYPAQYGLWGKPTVVQNVETLALVPWITRTGQGSGTKAVSLSGVVSRLTIVEIGLGTPLIHVLEEAGQGAPTGRS